MPKPSYQRNTTLILGEIMYGIPACKICLEPISNFICPDCIYRAIQQWMWKACPGLVERFRNFHKTFIESVASEMAAVCVVCRREYYHMICSYDYMKEVYSWLGEYLPDNQVKEFLRIFSMGFRRIDRRASGWFFYRNQGPNMLKNGEVDIGLCEVCENFSYGLKHDASNRMVCENCR